MNNSKKVNALIFIDTNIFLDFYRIRNSDVSLQYLEKIDQNRDKIITGSQVEMEFKKHRQFTILETLRNFKMPNWASMTSPAILEKSEPMKIIGDRKKEIEKQSKKVGARMLKILHNPSTQDKVYQTLQRLFKDKNNSFNLHRESDVRLEIRELAKKRFWLGYPPKKKSDTSIGDAVNWEWIIRCAIDSGKDIIIVTRDGDYGETYENKSFLNDWLLQEFKERVSQKRKIELTSRLSTALKKIEITVSKQMIEEEERIIKEKSQNNIGKLTNISSPVFLDDEIDEDDIENNP